MKTMKLGVVLLALLLAGMAMVPMVNAEQNANSVSTAEVSKIQLPQLQFNNSQQKVVVTEELRPSESTQSAQVTAMVATSKTPSVSTIPYGSIIYHSKDGITTVFDSDGRQMFAADDSISSKISTPYGVVPATQVQEIPSGSDVNVSGNNFFITHNGNLILTVINENENIKTMSASSFSWPNSWIEGMEGTPSGNLGEFTARWYVPSSPPETVTGTTGSMVMLFNGIQTVSGTSKIIQPVLEWHKKDTAGDPEPAAAWTGASWFAYTGSSPYLHSSRISGISPNDMIIGSMVYDSQNSRWTISFQDTTTSRATTMTVTNGMPNTNVEINAILEGYYLNSNRNICGDTAFSSFVIRDVNGNNNRPGSVTTKVNAVWSSQLSGLSVTNNWPYSMILNTAN